MDKTTVILSQVKRTSAIGYDRFCSKIRLVTRGYGRRNRRPGQLSDTSKSLYYAVYGAVKYERNTEPCKTDKRDQIRSLLVVNKIGYEQIWIS